MGKQIWEGTNFYPKNQCGKNGYENGVEGVAMETSVLEIT